MPQEHPFRPALFRFLKDLAANNSREWFQEHKGDYEDVARGPAREFVAACAPLLPRISRHLVADPRPVGGSLFRIHRDVRFSKDKSPYKTSVGIQFRHAEGRDAHAPGLYLHLEPGNVFCGLGMWRPDGPTLGRVREAIARDPSGWRRASGGKSFRERFELSGESLKRPPKGFDPDHPAVEDLKRKDFVAVARLQQKDVTRPTLPEEFVDLCKVGRPFLRYLCDAVGVAF